MYQIFLMTLQVDEVREVYPHFTDDGTETHTVGRIFLNSHS
jgi:hypothetical protein